MLLPQSYLISHTTQNPFEVIYNCWRATWTAVPSDSEVNVWFLTSLISVSNPGFQVQTPFWFWADHLISFVPFQPCICLLHFHCCTTSSVLIVLLLSRHPSLDENWVNKNIEHTQLSCFWLWPNTQTMSLTIECFLRRVSPLTLQYIPAALPHNTSQQLMGLRQRPHKGTCNFYWLKRIKMKQETSVLSWILRVSVNQSQNHLEKIARSQTWFRNMTCIYINQFALSCLIYILNYSWQSGLKKKKKEREREREKKMLLFIIR